MSNPSDPNRPNPAGPAGAPSRPRVDPMALIGESSSAPGSPARPAAAARPAARPAPAVSKPVAAPVVAPGTPVVGVVRPKAKALGKTMLFAGVGVVLLIAVGVAWMLLKPPAAVEGPRLNEPTANIAKFAASPDFAKLPFERQFAYMGLLDDHEDQLDEAYTAGKLNDVEYRKALQIAYFGKHLGRATKYAALPEGKEREAYLDKHLEKKKGGKHEDDESGKHGGITPLPKAPSAKEPVKIRRDESNQEVQIASWPAEVREKWVAYRVALDDRKDHLKAADKARDKAEKAERARAATQSSK